MQPLFFTLQSKRHLMAIPDTEAHLDGHALITYTYSLFIDQKKGDPAQALPKENTLHLDKINDPDYLGFVAFEKPANLFSYTAGQHELSLHEIEDIIEQLTIIRENPVLWRSIDKF